MLVPSALPERHAGASALQEMVEDGWEGDALEAGSPGLFTPGSPGFIQE